MSDGIASSLPQVDDGKGAQLQGIMAIIEKEVERQMKDKKKQLKEFINKL